MPGDASSVPLSAPPAPASGWRSHAFRSSYASRLRGPQAVRMDKIYAEPLFLLSSPSTSPSILSLGPRSSSSIRPSTAVARFNVSGSKGTPHVVTVFSEGRVDCSCQDARIHARRNDCACKHVCFVLVRAMGFTDLRFFRDGRVLPPEQVNLCSQAAMGRVDLDDSSLRPCFEHEKKLATEKDAFLAPSNALKANALRPGVDDCPVCYDALVPEGATLETLEGHRAVRWCPSCQNPVHKGCMERWLAQVPKPTCVMCRSVVWKEWNCL